MPLLPLLCLFTPRHYLHCHAARRCHFSKRHCHCRHYRHAAMPRMPPCCVALAVAAMLLFC
jgi:hypothetical protein